MYNLLNLWVNQVSIIDGFFHLCQEASSPRVLDVVIFVIDILIVYDVGVRAIESILLVEVVFYLLYYLVVQARVLLIIVDFELKVLISFALGDHGGFLVNHLVVSFDHLGWRPLCLRRAGFGSFLRSFNDINCLLVWLNKFVLASDLMCVSELSMKLTYIEALFEHLSAFLMLIIMICTLQDFFLFLVSGIIIVYLAAFFLVLGHLSIQELNDFILPLLQFFLSEQGFLRFLTQLVFPLRMEVGRQEMVWDVWIIWIDDSFLIL